MSPTHLLLMTGGLLMLTAPVRWAWNAAGIGDRPSMGTFAPALIGMTLAAAVVTFFFMYMSASWPVAWDGDDGDQAFGIASVLARNAIVVAPLLFLLRRWTVPFGTATVLFGVPAVLMGAMDMLRFWELIVAFVVAGLAIDVLLRRLDAPAGDPRTARIVGAAAPLALWSAFFATHAVAYPFEWPAEIWTGVITLAALSMYALAVFMHPRPAGALSE